MAKSKKKKMDWKKFHADNLSKIPQDMRERAIAALQIMIQESPTQANDIRQAMSEDPQEWWSGLHFTWGMAVRNWLRSNGFGEKELKVDNLDDVYIGLVEKAMENI